MRKPSPSSSSSWSTGLLLGLLIYLVATMPAVVNGHYEGDKAAAWKAQVQPRKGWNTFIAACLHKLTHQCADQLYHYIFNRQQTSDIFINCCNRMVRAGELCHRALSYSISRRSGLKKWRGHIYQRSLEGYSDCLRRV
ncbi:hypothetical protein MLD38_034771 [Melastoma candidum]|uniref:Uncharacterized protein n=1 Tax=Melastoma candidum TaxID=119954 RepID=A0ACB9MDF9_9MYRT|nr:hypothetical protein MLD38_034771 [Melastoma candidum]